MARVQRPTSPHLQVYAWGLHMVLSILHRATGAALGAGTLLLVWWLVALASGPEAYDQFIVCMGSLIGRIILFGFTWALMLHLCNGIRHLFWDLGKGFELSTTAKSNYLVLICSVILTLLAWVVGYGMI
ncbi:succinate dehydrogenase, cytochrome b556 subunit [Emcibacter nanhaiensis]|uniref:Succinate dehydrogenase cytochrome b556 subunit n=1 Tax=Emcibacter nanhaiensis TaxID=1505037 RepID=A0A501PNP7_9PROT|nr:succinate dehydrogenase, cytochrome b556 subunit [Emcibacter nanhaiensis]TPD61604.1 succinate dehydrogenase, cytochrome b556 subunit [Emcibacter nanhaiensis]